MTDIAGLTDRQIAEVYFHKRAKDGSIVPERKFGDSQDDTLRALELIKSLCKIDAETINVLKEQVKEGG